MAIVYIVRKDGREGGEILCVTMNRVTARTVTCDKFLEFNQPSYDREHQAFLALKAKNAADGDHTLDDWTHDPAINIGGYKTLEAWHEARAKLGDEKFWDETGHTGYCEISVDISEHELMP